MKEQENLNVVSRALPSLGRRNSEDPGNEVRIILLWSRTMNNQMVSWNNPTTQLPYVKKNMRVAD